MNALYLLNQYLLQTTKKYILGFENCAIFSNFRVALVKKSLRFPQILSWFKTTFLLRNNSVSIFEAAPITDIKT